MSAALAYLPFALLSGLFASLASVFAKLFTDTRTDAAIQWICSASQLYAGLDLCANQGDNVLLLVVRGTCFALIFGCNALMWTLLTKALNKATSSVQVTVVNSAINFCTTPSVGQTIIFHQPPGHPRERRLWRTARSAMVGRRELDSHRNAAHDKGAEQCERAREY
ncbi:hypothetical protein BC936DRAFT_144831 [Jimgerdemannia flammicorona]|uniref:Sugar phosphate transporter domain-containing protein n=1 Tax=Jimgerdemannia flammicorona TaxID=994334 RepID=A0A433DBJ0_9FUNG|nr:hypothetical protein BC936DRAFT_144831 [Jimgerdemannia flammicorona]